MVDPRTWIDALLPGELVSLDDAPHLRVVGNIEGDVHIGMPVVPHWEERTADEGTVVLLRQRRAASG